MTAVVHNTTSDTATYSCDLSVVIVNYNVRYFLEQCLVSVLEACSGLDAEIFVVDNDSHDDSLDMLRRFEGQLHVIANDVNLGFAKANNQAIRLAGGRYVLLLNPDTLVPPDAFQKCLDYTDANPDVGALGVRMIDGTGAYLPESKRGFPTPWVSFTKMSGLARLNDASPRLNGYYLGHLPEDQTSTIDVLPGAFMWLRSSALAKVGGGLDEDYFMYGEDIDLSYLMQQAGYRNIYFPEVSIIHYKGESTRKRSRAYVRTFYRAMVIFARKHVVGVGGGIQLLLLQAAIYARAAVAVIINTLAAIALPAADAVVAVGVLVAARWAWANYYFNVPDYFADSPFDYFNLPLYTGLWVASIALFGGYDRPYRLPAALRGVAIGTLLVLLTYALLPTTLRTSRALILIGGVGLAVGVTLLRIIWSFVKPGHVSWSARVEGRDRRVVVVGETAECARVLGLLARAGVARDYVGRVSPSANAKTKLSNQTTIGAALGSMDELERICEGYGVDEIIFCGADVGLPREVAAMRSLRGRAEFRHVAPATAAVVGSPSRDAPGSAYTVGVRYELATSGARRTKRALDIGVGLFVLLLAPLFILLGRAATLRNAASVLAGAATWVGYATGGESPGGLPMLRPCVVGQISDLSGATPVDVQRRNVAYARYYDAAIDLRILWRQRRTLGASPVAIQRLSPPRWPQHQLPTVNYTERHGA